MRRARSLAHQRRVLRAESAIAVRVAAEKRLTAELRGEEARRAELLKAVEAAQAAQAAQAAGSRHAGSPVWLPLAVREAHTAVLAQAAVLPRHAQAAARQELAACESRLRQLARTLAARRAEAPHQAAELQALQAALP
jgi:hypothetical protein